MRQRPSRRLVNVLRSTIDQLGRNTDLATDDPALTKLKGALLRRVADLQLADTPLVSGVDTAAVLNDGRASLPAEVVHGAGSPEPVQPPEQAA
jgi:hypothetical protein